MGTWSIPVKARIFSVLATCQATQEVSLSRSAEKELIYPQTIDQENPGAVVFGVTVAVGGRDLGVGGMTDVPDILFLPVGKKQKGWKFSISE